MLYFDKDTFFTLIVIISLLWLCYRIYSESAWFQLKCVVSDVNGRKYCLRERNRINEASDLLAKVEDRCKNLVKHMETKYGDDKRIKRLSEGFKKTVIQETLPTSTLTAYSENKGEKIAFCLAEKKNETKLIDLETLTFVAIHELSHIMTESIGHKPEFWQNFKFLLQGAKEAKIYMPQNFKKQPKEYCGMTIDDNPYYDYN